MSRKTVLDTYPDALGTRRLIRYSDGEGNVTVEMRQDCTNIVEGNKVLADEPPGKDFRLVARVPLATLNRAMIEGWLEDEAAWKRWLNDSDNRAFRVWGGRV